MTSQGERGQEAKHLKTPFLYKFVYTEDVMGKWETPIKLDFKLILAKWLFHLCLCVLVL